jgi:hypothetical protein
MAKHRVLELELGELQLQYLLEAGTPAPFLMMELLVVGEAIGLGNLEMERILIEAHQLKHRVLEPEEQQLQSLLERYTPVLFLIMHQLVVGVGIQMADLEMERILIGTHLLQHRVLERIEQLCLLRRIEMVTGHWTIWRITQTIVFEVLHAHLDNTEGIYA